MATIKVQAKKMSEASVSFISFVERGANRIPFKVIKQEKDMAKAFAGIDLGSLFVRKAEAPKTTIIGVVTMKGEGLESVKDQIETSGFDVSTPIDMEDGSVVFKQPGFENEGEGEVIRMSEHVALITKGFAPYNLDITDSPDGLQGSLTDLFRAEGFYPGLTSVLSTLQSMLESAVRKADTPDAAKAAVTKLFTETNTYVNSLLSNLPVTAFKLEFVVPEVRKAAISEGSSNVDALDDTSEATVEDQVAKGTKTETPKNGDIICKSCGTKMPTGTLKCPNCGADPLAEPVKKEEVALTPAMVSDIVNSTVEKSSVDLVAKMEGILEGLSTLTNSLTSLQSTVAGLGSRVETVEGVAKSAKDAIVGTLVGGGESADHNPVQKFETGTSRGREIDTAFMPRGRKSQQ